MSELLDINTGQLPVTKTIALLYISEWDSVTVLK